MTLSLSYIFTCMTSIFYFRTKFYYRIPTTGPGKYENQFLRPLTMSVWWCVIAMINLCGILLFITSKIEGRSSGAQYALFSVLASFCQQCQYQQFLNWTILSQGLPRVFFSLPSQYTEGSSLWWSTTSCRLRLLLPILKLLFISFQFSIVVLWKQEEYLQVKIFYSCYITQYRYIPNKNEFVSNKHPS